MHISKICIVTPFPGMHIYEICIVTPVLNIAYFENMHSHGVLKKRIPKIVTDSDDYRPLVRMLEMDNIKIPMLQSSSECDTPIALVCVAVSMSYVYI